MDYSGFVPSALASTVVSPEDTWVVCMAGEGRSTAEG